MRTAAASNILGVLIILSTMFLKQHSVIDVSLGLVMGMLMQIVADRIFVTEEERSFSKETVLGRKKDVFLAQDDRMN